DTHIFSPNSVNEFRFGYVRHNGSIVGDAPKGVDFADKNRVALFPFPVKGFPSITYNFSGNISGSQQFDGWGGGSSNLNFENRFQWADNLNMTRGSHTLKTGVDVRRARFESLKGDPFFGTFIFGSIFTSSSDTPGSGAPFADFLLGFPSTIQGTQMLDWGRQRDIYFGGYFQDDWKATRKLTLNLGIRYDVFTQPVDARDRGAVFDLATGRFALPGKDGYTRAVVDGDHNNIGPRVGFAYQAGPKLVVRGGYGIFYGLRDQNQEVTQFSGNNPNTPTLSVPTVTATGTIKPPFTINTPIIAAPSDTTLVSFTPERPFVRTIRTQGIHDSRVPTLHQLNVSVQYEPFQTWLFEVSLSGARGRDLASSFINKNQEPFAYALDGRNTQRNRPYPNINGTIPSTLSIATSSYHAANFKLEKRYSAGLNFLLNYTVQKNMESNGTGPSAYTQNGGTSIALDTYNLSRERTVAPIDVSQVFVISYGYELPWGPGRPWLSSGGPLGKIVGGWQVNGITYARGGFPTDVRTNVLPPIFNTFNVPDRVAGQPVQVQQNRSVDNFFNPNAFRVPGTVSSSTGARVQLFGDSARRVARGPGSGNFDFSVFKNTTITERYRLQFRAEFFNLTNTPTFFLPSGSDPTMTCSGPPGAACNAGNAQFGKLSNGTATGRQIQFGLKLIF
ncbi:MAG: TonB-dependent receptor, partial [Acidobacteria bacterium]|nr:TonB-dependent receptor [Acidobacteriota bacterium]